MEFRFDRSELRKGSAIRTDEGYIRADAIVTRTGVLPYRNNDGTTRLELRHPDEVFSKASLDSLKMVPVTNSHPTSGNRLVNSENALALQIGAVGEQVYPDGKYVMASMQVTTADGISAIDAGRVELSCGYTCELVKEDGIYDGERFTHRQRNIRYNHVAIVDRARAGSAARLNLDSGEAIQQEVTMGTKTVVLDGITYEAAPEVANALVKQTARADEAVAKVAGAESQLDALRAKFDEQATELTKLKAVDNSKAVNEAARARVALLTQAGKVLKADALEKLLDSDNRAVQEAVIKTKHAELKLDGQSDVYVQARFDAVIDALGKDAIAVQRQAAFSRADASGAESKSDEAKKKANDELTSMWKGKKSA